MPLDLPPSPVFSIELPFLQINPPISLSAYYVSSFILSPYAPFPYFLLCLPHLSPALSPSIYLSLPSAFSFLFLPGGAGY